jgi:Tc toxin complex TcA C-terminal TcB-binding domain
VDTIWRLELPKAANPFDYSTIADVLLTLEYTALNSFDYRQQVIQTLDPELNVDRPFSFREQFPDQWYELSNPDQAATPMRVRFKTTRADFVPNIDDLTIQHLLLYFAPTNGKPVEIQNARLRFKEFGDDASVGGSADSIDGLISTRRANGNKWLPITGNRPPRGEWELKLPTDDRTKNLFKNEKIQDILFVITYSGRTPEWPG